MTNIQEIGQVYDGRKSESDKHGSHRTATMLELNRENAGAPESPDAFETGRADEVQREQRSDA